MKENEFDYLVKEHPDDSLEEDIDFMIEHQELIELKQRIYTALQEEETTPLVLNKEAIIVSMISRWRRFGGVAAAILLIATLGYVFYINTNPALDIADYYEPPNITMHNEILHLEEISSASTMDETDKWERIIQLYDNKEYKQVEKLLSEIIDKNPAMKFAYFYRGNINYLLEEYDKSIEDFTDVIEHASGEKLIANAKWYLVLVHLKMGNKNIARKYLGELTSTNFANENVEKLLQDLELRDTNEK